MNYSGEYIQPARRRTAVLAPAVSGYTTVRLKPQGGLVDVASVEEQRVDVLIENTGSASLTLQFQETSDRHPGISRTNVGSSLTIVPGGHKSATIYPRKAFLEIKTTSGNGSFRAQLDSLIRFDTLSFDRSDTLYPSALWEDTASEDATLPYPPDAPSDLEAVIDGYNVNLSWTDNSDGEGAFVIYHKGSAYSDYVEIDRVDADEVSYVDEEPDADTYSYVVRAVNSGGLSNMSNSDSVEVELPVAPTDLSAVMDGYDVAVTWTDPASVENIIVYRGTSAGGPYTVLDTVAAGTESYTDTTPASDTYYYVVRAVNPNGQSSLSEEATLAVPVPDAPSVLSATFNDPDVDLTWTDNSDDEAEFVIYRGTAEGGPYTEIATVAADAETYTDEAPDPDTYYYVVSARNPNGEAEMSNEDSLEVTESG